jgi:hypothetical protein
MNALVPYRARFARSCFLAGLVIFGAACAKITPPPVISKPKLSESSDARPALLPSHLTVSLESQLSAFAPLLKDVIAEKLAIDQDEWTDAAGPKGTDIETRIHAAVTEEPTLRMRDSTLTISIPISYYGDVRARAKTPLGTVWLTHGTPWGTKEEPGRIVLHVEVETDVRKGAKVFTDSKLTQVVFTAPKGESICTSGLVRICVTRAKAAEYVHAEIEKNIRKEAPRALAALDDTIAREANLSRVIDPALAALHTPQQTALGTWLSLAPKAAALTRFSGKDDVLALGAELWLEPTFSIEKPEAPNEKVLIRDPTSEPSALRLDLIIPFAQLSRAYTEAARRIRTGAAKVVEVTVLGLDADRKHLVLSIVLERDKRRVEIFALAEPISRDGALVLRETTPTQASQPGLLYMRARANELSQALAREAVVPLAPFLADHVSAIRARMATLLLPFGAFELTPEKQSFEEHVGFEKSALRVRSELFVAARLTR